MATAIELSEAHILSYSTRVHSSAEVPARSKDGPNEGSSARAEQRALTSCILYNGGTMVRAFECQGDIQAQLKQQEQDRHQQQQLLTPHPRELSLVFFLLLGFASALQPRPSVHFTVVSALPSLNALLTWSPRLLSSSNHPVAAPPINVVALHPIISGLTCLPFHPHLLVFLSLQSCSRCPLVSFF